MTINDQELTDLMIVIHRNHATLEYLTREGKEATLFIALSDIEKAAHNAQIRLNQLRFGKS